MSFLDNLENNLKALENREERDPAKLQRDREQREADKKAAELRAPHAEALKSSAFTNELLTECRLLGQKQKMLVRFTWLGETLRLDAKEKRVELVPTPEGIVAVFTLDGQETKRAKVDLEKDDPAAFAKNWLNR
jgi:hypothetical protein